MPRPRLAAVLVPPLLFAVALAACSDSGPATTASSQNGPPAGGQSSHPAALASPVDQKLINLQFQFCLDTDQAVRREAPLLEPPISSKEAKRRLSQAQVIAEAQVEAFAQAGYHDEAQMMRAWADGFARGRKMINQGARPVDALHPAVHAVSVLFRAIDCEGDA